MTGSALVTKRPGVRIIFGVTRGAILWRAFEDAVNVAALTGDSGMFPVKVERELRVIHCCRFPSVGRVTCSAERAERTVMSIILEMAGSAVHGRAFEDTVLMAVRTSGIRVFAVKVESKLRMVNCCGFPSSGRVT